MLDSLPANTATVNVFVREFPQEWPTKPAGIVPSTESFFVATGLSPTSTFEFKLQCVSSDGTVSPMGPPVAADTLAAGCVPKDEEKKKTCSIM